MATSAQQTGTNEWQSAPAVLQALALAASAAGKASAQAFCVLDDPEKVVGAAASAYTYGRLYQQQNMQRRKEEAVAASAANVAMAAAIAVRHLGSDEQPGKQLRNLRRTRERAHRADHEDSKITKIDHSTCKSNGSISYTWDCPPFPPRTARSTRFSTRFLEKETYFIYMLCPHGPIDGTSELEADSRERAS